MSIRLRVTVVFMLALAVAFALGSWLFISQLQTQLFKSLDLTLKAQLTPYRTAASGAPPRTRVRTGMTYLIQVIGPSGRVVRYNGEAGTAPLLGAGQLALARSGPLAQTVHSEDELVRIYARPVGGTSAVAVAAQSLEDTGIHSSRGRRPTQKDCGASTSQNCPAGALVP